MFVYRQQYNYRYDIYAKPKQHTCLWMLHCIRVSVLTDIIKTLQCPYYRKKTTICNNSIYAHPVSKTIINDICRNRIHSLEHKKYKLSHCNFITSYLNFNLNLNLKSFQSYSSQCTHLLSRLTRLILSSAYPKNLSHTNMKQYPNSVIVPRIIVITHTTCNADMDS